MAGQSLQASLELSLVLLHPFLVRIDDVSDLDECVRDSYVHLVHHLYRSVHIPIHSKISQPYLICTSIKGSEYNAFD